MTAEISKTEYLKRYLDDVKVKTKTNKKVKKKLQPSRFKIIDGDIDLKSIHFGNDVQKGEAGSDEEVPTVAEVIDERPDSVKVKEQFESSRWKKVTNDNDTSENASECDRLQLADNSPLPRKRRYDSDSDVSLPRNSTNKKTQSDDSDVSPPRRPVKLKKISGDDNSSPRKHKRNSHDTHRSYTKLSAVSSKTSALTKSRCDSDSDISLERYPAQSNENNKQGNLDDSDYSPPRQNDFRDKSKKERSDRTLSGLKAGLQNAKTLKEESKDLRKRERKKIVEMDEELSGRNAATVLRDRQTGLKRDLAEEQRLKDKEESKVAEHQQKYVKWGKGIEQTEEMQNKISEDLYETSKPLARYRDDEDLEERLKSADREGDTMAAYIKKKKKLVPNTPQYNGPDPPPNRFGIAPGYRWDGVDRSNGFEKKFYEKLNKTKATESESYLWSVQDM